jgi:hypothetical protein
MVVGPRSSLTVSEIVAAPCGVPEFAVTVTVEVVDTEVGAGARIRGRAGEGLGLRERTRTYRRKCAALPDVHLERSEMLASSWTTGY